MADVIGIIAAGRLVREGTMTELLHGADLVRVRVAADEVAPPCDRLQQLAGVGAGRGRRCGCRMDHRPRLGARAASELNRVAGRGRDLRRTGWKPAATSKSCSCRSPLTSRTATKGRSRASPAPSDRAGGRLVRIFRSGARTPLRRPATWLTFGILTGLLVLIIVARGGDRRRGRCGPERPAAAHLPAGLPDHPQLHHRPRRPVRDHLRGGGRRVGVVVGHPEGGRRPRREPEPIHPADLRRGGGLPAGGHRLRRSSSGWPPRSWAPTSPASRPTA